MPRIRNPVGIAAGKLILAIREAGSEPDAVAAQKVLDRAHRLLQASQSGSVSNLLDGRSVEEYLDPAWVAGHPSIALSLEAFVAAVKAYESA